MMLEASKIAGFRKRLRNQASPSMSKNRKFDPINRTVAMLLSWRLEVVICGNQRAIFEA